MSEIKRGDIVFVHNLFSAGNLLMKDRPAIVISNDKNNENSNNICVAYLSSKIKRLDLPTHVLIRFYKGLPFPSLAQLEQITTIPKDNVKAVLDHLREEDEIAVNNAIRVSLGLEVKDAAN